MTVRCSAIFTLALSYAALVKMRKALLQSASHNLQPTTPHEYKFQQIMNISYECKRNFDNYLIPSALLLARYTYKYPRLRKPKHHNRKTTLLRIALPCYAWFSAWKIMIIRNGRHDNSTKHLAFSQYLLAIYSTVTPKAGFGISD